VHDRVIDWQVMGYLRNKKKKEEERDLPNIEGSRARME
jgi:hypothetical protein